MLNCIYHLPVGAMVGHALCLNPEPRKVCGCRIIPFKLVEYGFCLVWFDDSIIIMKKGAEIIKDDVLFPRITLVGSRW